MTTKELLRDKLAPAVGRVILKYAFGVDVSTIGGPFLDWLAGKFKDQDQARQAERFARNIANNVVDGLVPVFEQDHSPDLNPEAVALALGDTLDQYIDGEFLVAHDLDPKQLIEGAFDLRPLTELKREGYATSDIALYRRALPELIAALVPRAKAFGDFEIANVAEILKRLRDLSQEGRRTREGVDYLVRAQQVWERRRAEAWRAFERDYAEAILDVGTSSSCSASTCQPKSNASRNSLLLTFSSTCKAPAPKTPPLGRDHWPPLKNCWRGRPRTGSRS